MWSTLARTLDMFRVFPRLVLLVYVIGLMISFNWYISFDIKPQIECEAQVLEVILDKGYNLDDAKEIACKQVGSIGRPTGYTALLSTMFGAGAVIFGFYTNSGWRWKPKDENQ